MVATMYIDTSHLTRGGKTYTRHLLRESYRAHGKVLHRTIANVSHCSAAEIEALPLGSAPQGRLGSTWARSPDSLTSSSKGCPLGRYGRCTTWPDAWG